MTKTKEADKRQVRLKEYVNDILNQFPNGDSDYWVETLEGNKKDARTVVMTGSDKSQALFPPHPDKTLHSRECVKVFQALGFNTGMPKLKRASITKKTSPKIKREPINV
ncbi:Uncharacterised protein [uncultured archaeon]|nr:Uncharacterised protein [uncultured archaeon]